MQLSLFGYCHFWTLKAFELHFHTLNNCPKPYFLQHLEH